MAKKPIKYILWAIAAISIVVLGYSSYLVWKTARVAVGYKTKTLCSGVLFGGNGESSQIRRMDELGATAYGLGSLGHGRLFY